jgi:WhiB family redox-sensing transcriptional regulator
VTSQVTPLIITASPGAWQGQGLCIDLSDTAFFLDGDDYAGLKKAKAVCAQCPVKDECLDFAIESNQSLGVWGGASPNERRQIRRGWLRERAS